MHTWKERAALAGIVKSWYMAAWKILSTLALTMPRMVLKPAFCEASQGKQRVEAQPALEGGAAPRQLPAANPLSTIHSLPPT